MNKSIELRELLFSSVLKNRKDWDNRIEWDISVKLFYPTSTSVTAVDLTPLLQLQHFCCKVPKIRFSPRSRVPVSEGLKLTKSVNSPIFMTIN